MDMTLGKADDFEEESGNKDSYLPKESESDVSSSDMIIFVDPEEYESKLASRRKGFNGYIPQPQ